MRYVTAGAVAYGVLAYMHNLLLIGKLRLNIKFLNLFYAFF